MKYFMKILPWLFGTFIGISIALTVINYCVYSSIPKQQISYCEDSGGIQSISNAGFGTSGIVACKDNSVEKYRGINENITNGTVAQMALIQESNDLSIAAAVFMAFGILLMFRWLYPV